MFAQSILKVLSEDRGRDGNDQSREGRHQGDIDPFAELFAPAPVRAEGSRFVERDDHPPDRAEQAHQRGGGRGQTEPADGGGLVVRFALQCLGGCPFDIGDRLAGTQQHRRNGCR
jgi:hypothetical protein